MTSSGRSRYSLARASEGGGSDGVGPQSESPVACTVRAGGQSRSLARAGEGGGLPPAARARDPSRPHCGAPSGQGGTAGPRPGPVRAAGTTTSARDPSHLRLAPPGREDNVAPRPGPMRAAGCRRGGERTWSESPAACTVRAGGQCRSLARAGGGGGQAPELAPSGREGNAAPRPGPMRASDRRCRSGGESVHPLAPAAAARVRRIPGSTRRSEHPCRLDPPLLLRPGCGRRVG